MFSYFCQINYFLMLLCFFCIAQDLYIAREISIIPSYLVITMQNILINAISYNEKLT